MKKLLQKALNKQSAPPETGGRITNETVAVHRERVLAGGRKFKYPLQYTKHRLLIITIIIVVITTVSFFGFCGWQLYSVQSTDKFIYSVTQFIPVPVAKVNGAWVRYSDYLLGLRSTIHYLSTKEAVNFNSDDGRRQLDYQKRLALDKAIKDTFVSQLASQNHISVSQKEIDDFAQQQVSAKRLGVDEAKYKQVLRDYYDWSFDDFKNSIREQLLQKKVMAQLDTDSKQTINDILKSIQQGADFTTTAKAKSEDVATKAQGGDMGVVNQSTNDPNGLVVAASKLQPGQVSQVIEGADGFYIVKLLDKPSSDSLHIAKIYVSYKVLDKKLADLKQNGQIQEFIAVKQVAPPSNQ